MIKFLTQTSTVLLWQYELFLTGVSTHQKIHHQRYITNTTTSWENGESWDWTDLNIEAFESGDLSLKTEKVTSCRKLKSK